MMAFSKFNFKKHTTSIGVTSYLLLSHLWQITTVKNPSTTEGLYLRGGLHNIYLKYNHGIEQIFDYSWRTLTYPFVHLGWEHLFYNILAFVLTAWWLEDKKVQKKVWLLFWGGNLMGSFYNIFSSDPQLIVGASAGILAMLTYVALEILQEGHRQLFLKRKDYAMPYAIAFVMMGWILYILKTDSNPVSTILHSCGFLIGGVVALLERIKEAKAVFKKLNK